MDEFLKPSRRLKLHEIFEKIIKEYKGDVYFQPPSSDKMIYPCIKYQMEDIDTVHADSIKYKNRRRYSVTVIDRNPDSEIPNKILALAYSDFDRFFVVDNLNHFVFTLYY